MTLYICVNTEIVQKWKTYTCNNKFMIIFIIFVTNKCKLTLQVDTTSSQSVKKGRNYIMWLVSACADYNVYNCITVRMEKNIHR